MRRWHAIARATAFEMISEPLSLLLLISALSLAVLAPAFHYHQFGEATRMARDSGLSALFTGGLAFAVFVTIKSFRREFESGTAAMALAHSLSRGAFFTAKVAGALAAYAVYAATVAATTLVMVRGAEIGGAVAARTGDIARVWGPSFAIGVCAVVVPPIAAAALNRFARFRFVSTSFLLALLLSVGGAAYSFRASLASSLAPVMVLAAAVAPAFLCAAAAFSARFRANASAAATGLVFAAFLPCVGAYYMSDALSRGGFLPWSYVGVAAFALVPAEAAFILLGVHFLDRLDLQ